MQRYFASLSSIGLLLALAACGGGGGGGSTTPAAQATPTPVPSISGDMLALKPSQGWNYQSTYNNTSVTATLYVDPNPVNGVTTLVGAGVTGLVPTVATSATNMTQNLMGELGIKVDTSANYNIYSEYSVGSLALVPGDPVLVPSSLTLGQSWTPTTGATAKVISIGAVPGQSACPNATSSTVGVTVEYTYPNYDDTIAYVPGCGITDMKNPSNGAEFTLVSTASYASLGSLDRRAAQATYLDTAASLLGLRRSNLRGANVLHSLFSH
ncbi:MAG: hypothetical protein JO322_06160 [Candidatus Eremiobacteraeota bacterium]|nr:hypothetical protein [Candidatus Eremiobacteraeota bacterium]